MVDLGEAFGQGHADGFGRKVELEDEGVGEGDEEFAAFGGRDGEQRRGVFEAVGSVGRRGELDGVDEADGLAAIVDGASDEVGDVGGAGLERGSFGEGDEDLFAGELLGLLDGVDAGKVEHDAAGVAADGEPVGGDVDGLRRCGWGGSGRSIGRGGSGEAGGCEEDAGMAGEAAGEVGEEVGEDLSLASLGAQDLGQHDPCRIAIHELDGRAVLRLRWRGQSVGAPFSVGKNGEQTRGHELPL